MYTFNIQVIKQDGTSFDYLEIYPDATEAILAAMNKHGIRNKYKVTKVPTPKLTSVYFVEKSPVATIAEIIDHIGKCGK